MRIFLSYRRSDVGGHAGRLADALLQRLGAKSVFQDVIAIAPGQDFTVELDRALDDSDAVLAVIGPGWLTAATPQGAPRLFEADDYVRLELARALNRNVRVVPVLVGGAALPAATDLPDELRGLVHRQAVVLHDETWHQDVDGLVGSLRGEPAVPARQNRRWVVVGAVAVALVVFSAAAWLWGPGIGKAPGTGEGPGSGGQVGSESRLASCAPPEGPGWTAIELYNNPTGEAKGPGGSLLFTVKDARWRARGEKWQVTLATSMKNTRPDAVSQPAYYYGPLIVAQQEFKATCFRPSPTWLTPSRSATSSSASRSHVSRWDTLSSRLRAASGSGSAKTPLRETADRAVPWGGPPSTPMWPTRPAGVSGDWYPRRLLRESAPLLASILFEADRAGAGPQFTSFLRHLR